MKNQKGITLIALVITIIVLLILAGVAIAMLSGDNGILNRASQAGKDTAISSAKEEIGLVVNEAITDYFNNVFVEDKPQEGGVQKAVRDELDKISASEYEHITYAPPAAEPYYRLTDEDSTFELKKTETADGELGKKVQDKIYVISIVFKDDKEKHYGIIDEGGKLKWIDDKTTVEKWDEAIKKLDPGE